MNDWKEKRKKTAVRTVQEIQERCTPLLVGFGGSIAYGLDTPKSDIDIRGIFLNPREEWIGLREETENIRLEDSDTVVYGLRKAMKLLLNGNPNVIEMLGLRPEHILYCSEGGKRILDNTDLFLSRRVGITFGAFAVNLRKQLQREVLEGKTDAEKLCKEMAHLIRVYAMGGDLLVNGRVVTWREHEHDLLTEIRAGKYLDRKRVPTAAYERLLEDYMGSFQSAMISTHLPAEPDWERASALTMEIVYPTL